METQEVRTDRLRHEVLGAGNGRPLLLLHGLTASKADLVALVEPLADRGWEVVAPDQRGHGASDWPTDPATYSLDALTTDAWALVDRLGWGEVVVVGHSLGGVVAQLMALDAPERIHGLALVASIPGPLAGGPSTGARAAAGRLRRAGAGLAGRLRSRGDGDGRPDAAGAAATGGPGGAAHSPVMLPAVLDAMFRAPDRTPALRGLDVPTLVVGGALDADHLHGSHALAEAVPGARLVVLDGVGHEVPTQAPGALLAALLPFLDGLPGDAT